MSEAQGKIPIEDAVRLEGLTKPKLVERIHELEEKLEKLSHAKRDVKHDPRPNVRYTLIDVPAGFKMPPQVGQILTVLGKAAKRRKTDTLTEPEVFAALEQAKEDGAFSTKQSAPRVFQYYRPRMKDEGVIVESADVAEAVDRAA